MVAQLVAGLPVVAVSVLEATLDRICGTQGPRWKWLITLHVSARSVGSNWVVQAEYTMGLGE